jgi:hypothetical protein
VADLGTLSPTGWSEPVRATDPAGGWSAGAEPDGRLVCRCTANGVRGGRWPCGR